MRNWFGISVEGCVKGFIGFLLLLVVKELIIKGWEEMFFLGIVSS